MQNLIIFIWKYLIVLLMIQIKKTWKIINSLLGKNNKPNDNVIDDTTVSDANHIANEFNNYFINIGSNLGSECSATARNINSCSLNLSDHSSVIS